MVKKHVIIFLIGICYKLAFSAISPAVIHGAQIFQQYCSACHSVKYLESNRELPSFPLKETPAILGIHPPDLSLEVNVRGAHWVYAYLDSFYLDPKSPTGMNNKVYPGTVMPNMLGGLKVQLSPQEFHETLNDLVSFLSYASDPYQEKRKKLGYWVVGFFCFFAISLYGLFFYIRREILNKSTY